MKQTWFLRVTEQRKEQLSGSHDKLLRSKITTDPRSELRRACQYLRYRRDPSNSLSSSRPSVVYLLFDATRSSWIPDYQPNSSFSTTPSSQYHLPDLRNGYHGSSMARQEIRYRYVRPLQFQYPWIWLGSFLDRQKARERSPSDFLTCFFQRGLYRPLLATAVQLSPNKECHAIFCKTRESEDRINSWQSHVWCRETAIPMGGQVPSIW